ncbi:hypothetical protein N2152v2_002747 [Parachlorella kessleri]
MKFAHYLDTLNRDSPVEWRDRFLKYKLLKKLLKLCSPDGPDAAVCESRFFDELRKQLDAANRHFSCNAGKIIETFHRQQSPPLCCWLLGRRRSAQKASGLLDAALAERAYWCRKFAKANAVALRKILKKHDKWCSNTAGREFLQECWRSDVKKGVGLFLHSPLLDELKAIQDVLQSQLPPEDPDLVERAPAPAGAAKQGQPGPTPTQPAGSQPMPLKPLSVNTGRGCGAVGRVSLESQGSAYNCACGAGTGEGGACGSCSDWASTSSFRNQKQRALSAIVESPTCMLDTGDFDWAGTSQPGSPLAVGPASAAGVPRRSPPASAARSDGHSARSAGLPEGWAASPPATATGPGSISLPSILEEGRTEGLHPAVVTPPLSAAGGVGGAPGCGVGVPELRGSGSTKFREEELKCPICLDFMYKPVGLGCGHKFCRNCALEAAGFGRAIGAFHNIISHIPARVGCPQCRQQGVYRNAVALREVGKLIQTRYPEEWAERRTEDKARVKQLQSAVTSRNQQLLHTRNAYELLFTF